MNEELIIEENVCFKICMVKYIQTFVTIKLYLKCALHLRGEENWGWLQDGQRWMKSKDLLIMIVRSTKMTDEKDRRDQTLDNSRIYIENKTTSFHIGFLISDTKLTFLMYVIGYLLP